MSELDILRSIQFVVDQKGQPAAVQLGIDAWRSLLEWIEDLEDRALIKEKLSRLRMGPESAGALRWEDVEAAWDADELESGS